MPRTSDLDGGRIPDLWPSCFLLDVSAGEPTFGYVGETHRATLGRDPTGTALATLEPDTLLAHAASYHARVLARAIPITIGGQFVDRDGCGILYRSILLPLGDDGRIAALLGGANGRAVAADGPMAMP